MCHFSRSVPFLFFRLFFFPVHTCQYFTRATVISHGHCIKETKASKNPQTGHYMFEINKWGKIKKKKKREASAGESKEIPDLKKQKAAMPCKVTCCICGLSRPLTRVTKRMSEKRRTGSYLYIYILHIWISFFFTRSLFIFLVEDSLHGRGRSEERG